MTTTSDTLILSVIESNAAKAETVRSDFLAQVERNGVGYAIQWGEAAARDENIATRWQFVANGLANDLDLVDLLTAAINQAAYELFQNVHAPTSSSMFSNAVGSALREAAARFHRDASSMLDHLNRDAD